MCRINHNHFHWHVEKKSRRIYYYVVYCSHLGSISFTCDRNNVHFEECIKLYLGSDTGSSFHKHQPCTLFDSIGVQITTAVFGTDGDNEQSLGRFILRLFRLVAGQPVGEDSTERAAVTRTSQASLDIALGNAR